MLDFFQTVRSRHSIRRYQPARPVPREHLHAILETASAAPSAGDRQLYRIAVAENGDTRAALAAAAERQDFVRQAPVCLVFFADTAAGEREFGDRGQRFSLQDATIAASYAQLAAAATGLGSTWVGRFEAAGVAAACRAPDSLEPVCLLSLGYPAEQPELTPRRPLPELLL
ncbi:MAG: nitroreductase family protein [Pseudomonadota bacterium]|nr:nitroreductase family protein [Pseudomonadota bacterium]HJO35890.1 nitroreductase family protein [Gammaproteobacteria bacterium]